MNYNHHWEIFNSLIIRRIRINSGVLIFFICFILLFIPVSAAPSGELSLNSSWWDSNSSDIQVWTCRIPVDLSENMGIPRVNEPVTLEFGEIFGFGYNYSDINPNSIRVVDPTEISNEIREVNGNDVPSQIEHMSATSGLSKDDLLIFLSNVSANSKKTYYIYYSRDSSIPRNSYPQISWNLASNPGFESGSGSSATSWLTLENSYSRVSGTSNNGNFSVQMSSSDTSQNLGIHQSISLSPSGKWETITIGGWIKANNIDGYRNWGNSIYTALDYDSGTFLYAHPALLDTSTYNWQKYEGVLHPTGWVKRIDAGLLFQGHSGTTWLDDFFIYTCAYSVTIGDIVEYTGGGTIVPQPPPIHPRLYFQASDLQALKTKMQVAPTSVTWSEITSIAKTFNSFPTGIGDTDAEWNANVGLRYSAIYYALTGDTTVGNKGKEWLLQISSWPSWTPPNGGSHRVNYNTGLIAIAVGEAYDMLYPLMTETERETVRKAIFEKAVKPAFLDYNDGSYLDDARSNRAAQGYGGIGVAALSIKGDGIDSAEVDYYSRVFTPVINEYLDAYDSDGAWAEGIDYQSFGQCSGSGAIYYLEADKRVTGENLYTNKNFSHSIEYPLYLLPPDRKGSSDSFGDTSFVGGYSAGALETLSSSYNDGHGKWYLANVPSSTYDRIPIFLWSNSNVTVSSPSSLPKSKLFHGVGVMAMRSGWNLTDTLISFRSSPVYNGHNRPEQNSFTLDALGERLIIEPGNPVGGYTDPTYESYYAATISQNTILINGDPHSQSELTIDGGVLSKPAGRIVEHYSADFYDEVEGNATDAYNGKLSKFNRYIVYIKPDYLIILDDMASANGSVEFDSVWHSLGTNNIAVNGDNITIARNNVKLYARVFIQDFTYSIATGQPYNIKDGAIPTSYIKMHSSLPSSGASYLYVLSPKQGNEIAPQVIKIQNGSVTGVRIQQSNIIDIMLFNPSGPGITLAGVTTDGDKAYVRLENGKVTRYAMQNGKSLVYNGTVLFSAKIKTSTAAIYTDILTDNQHTFGAPGCRPIVGDWNQDGKEEMGVFLNGGWWLDTNGNGIWDTGDDYFTFGSPGVQAVTGDWNNDGKDEMGVFLNGGWWLDTNGNGIWDTGDDYFTFGSPGVQAVTGDWNNDGKDEMGVFLNGRWWLDTNGSGIWDTGDDYFTFGSPGVQVVTGDWNNDGKDEMGVFLNGGWWLDTNGNGIFDP
jgi:hypothetical protein